MSPRTPAGRTQPRRIPVGPGNRGSTVAAAAAPPRSPLVATGGRRGRGNPLDFVRDVRSELRKVAWPSQRETVNLTAVVLAFSIAVGLFLGGVDFLFQELFRFLLGLQGGGGF